MINNIIRGLEETYGVSITEHTGRGWIVSTPTGTRLAEFRTLKELSAALASMENRT